MTIDIRSSGASAIHSRQNRSTSGESSIFQKIGPARIVGPTGTSSNSNSVTMPRFEPAPRIPQNSSGFSSALAVRNSPSAVTTSTRRSLSIESPCLRWIQPMPPPSVRPATPVCVTIPDGAASPKACVSLSSSPRSTPACTRAVRCCGSMRTPFSRLRSIMRESSATDRPACSDVVDWLLDVDDEQQDQRNDQNDEEPVADGKSADQREKDQQQHEYP